MMKYSRKNKGSGFTLVEILVVIAIMLILTIGISGFARNLFLFLSTEQSSLSAQSDALNILRHMEGELRTASISNAGAYPLAQVAPTSLEFYSDINGNGKKEQVHYYLKGTTLYKDVWIPSGNPLVFTGASTTSIVISNVANGPSTPIFQYYDANYNGLTDPLAQPVNIAAVTLIKITVLIATRENNATSSVPVAVTTQVALRNLKTNL